MARGRSKGASGFSFGNEGSNPTNDGSGSVVGNGTGNNEGSLPEIDPGSAASADSGTDGTEPKRRRGRPPGSKNRTTKEAATDLAGLEALMLSIHLGMAAILKAPEFMLDGEEAKRLAVASKNVARHYNLEGSQKAMDITALIVVALGIYGPRFAALSMRRKDEKKSKQQETTTNVTFHPAVAARPIG